MIGPLVIARLLKLKENYTVFSSFPSRAGSPSRWQWKLLGVVSGKTLYWGDSHVNHTHTPSLPFCLLLYKTRGCWGNLEGVWGWILRPKDGGTKEWREQRDTWWTVLSWTYLMGEKINLYFVEATVIWGLSKWQPNQSLWYLFNPMDYSPPGSSVHGIVQARRLEWGAISFSRESSQLRDGTQVFSLKTDYLPSEPPGKPYYYLDTR